MSPSGHLLVQLGLRHLLDTDLAHVDVGGKVRVVADLGAASSFCPASEESTCLAWMPQPPASMLSAIAAFGRVLLVDAKKHMTLQEPMRDTRVPGTFGLQFIGAGAFGTIKKASISARVSVWMAWSPDGRALSLHIVSRLAPVAQYIWHIFFFG